MTAAARPTIVVVDDERDIRIALEDLLEGDYRVLSFGEPAAALDRLAQEPDVAVIISDQRMPQMPGNRFLAAARAVTDAEAILLTGYADMEAVIAAINEGKVAGYVHKPWSADALRTMVDLAAQRHALRRALELERRLFDGLVQGSNDAIRLIAADGSTLRANRSGGYEPDSQDRAVLAGAPVDTEEVEAGERWLRVQRIALEAPGGERLLLRIESDVTQERAVERRLRQAEKLQALGTLAGGIAHDFNNLLTAVIGNLELATRRPDHPSLPRFLQGALEAARRGATLTARLLSFSRQRGIAQRDVDLQALIAGMTDLLARTLGGGIEVVVENCDTPLFVLADPDQLELALLNLCVNARDALGGTGTVRIRCGIEPGDAGELVSLEVIDRGVGMSEATKARVFEPFFTTKPVGQGTGLGLAMVYGMVTGLGGTVRIKSEEGEGTTVTLLLPQASGDPAPKPKTVPAALPPTQPLDILLVEDDPAVRAVTAAMLQDLGHRLRIAAGPDEARTMLADRAPLRLMITDYAMPGMSGLDLAAAARRLHPELPVLLLTGFADDAWVPDDVRRLAKPFSREALVTAIAETVGHPATPA